MQSIGIVASGAAFALMLLAGAGRSQETLLEVSSPATFDTFGFALDGGGDVNGDGVPDVIVGKPGAEAPAGGPDNVGGVEVRSGADGSLIHELFGDHVTSLVTATAFGWSVAHLGDVDGDGFGDFAVGSPGFTLSVFALNAGAVFAYSGQTGAELWSSVALDGKERFGYSLAAVGDVDGDGVSDVAVGMNCEGCSSFKGGYVRVLSGVDGSPLHFDFVPGPALAGFGRAVGAAGDANADGVPDVVVGAVFGSAAGGPPVAGDAYVYDGDDFSVLSITGGDDSGDNYGRAVGPAGDPNLDGLADIVVGSVGDSGDGGLTTPGSVKIVAGESGALLHTVYGPGHSSMFGASVDGGFDLNSDGVSDFVVGAREEDVQFGEEGAVHAYSGVDASELWTVQGFGPDTMFGYEVRGAGDVNGDGFADVVTTSLPAVGQSGVARVVTGACGSISAYGSGCPGSNGLVPGFDVSGCTAALTELSLSFSDGPASGFAFLFLGVDQAALPMAGGCTLLVSPPLGPFGPLPLSAAGDLTVPLLVPADLVGTSFTMQAFVQDPGLPHGFANSPGALVEVL